MSKFKGEDKESELTRVGNLFLFLFVGLLIVVVLRPALCAAEAAYERRMAFVWNHKRVVAFPDYCINFVGKWS